MCQACDLLTGLEPAALIPEEILRREPVVYVDGPGTAPVGALHPVEASPLAGRALRFMPAGQDIHGESPGWRAWRDAVLQAAAAADAAAPTWTPSQAGVRFYAAFRDAVDADAMLPGGMRCVLGWPTPCTLLLAPGGPDLAGLEAEAIDALLLKLEQAIAAELTFLLARLPADRVTLQFSASGELRVWETRARDIASRRSLPQRVLHGYATLSRACVAGLEVGFHYCRRDAFTAQAAAVTGLDQACRLVGATLSAFEHAPVWVHLNVPARFTELMAFEALANLVHWPELEVHLGVVRAADGRGVSEDQLQLARLALPWAAPSLPCGVDPSAVLPVLEAMPRVLAHDSGPEAVERP